MTNELDVTYKTPFCKGYWISALKELKNPRMMIIAALITAFRIVLKAFSIPVFGKFVSITFGFYANALGSMIYGPIWGLLSGIVSDTLGALIFPSGTYFAPFMITECLGSVIYALYLYKAKLSVSRVFLAKFSVIIICNLLLTPIITYWYCIYFGQTAIYKVITTARLLKNIAMFPIESTLLTVFLSLISKLTDKMKLTNAYSDNIKITTKHIIFIIVLTVVSVGVFFLCYFLMPR